MAVMLILFLQPLPAQSVNAPPENMPSFAGKYNKTILGPDVFVFSPEMNMREVQALLDTIAGNQTKHGNEFSKNRYAIIFKPGHYKLDIRVGYYMQVFGMGPSPDDVVIEGAVRSKSAYNGMVLTNFWRAAENLSVIPTVEKANVWGVSQAAPMRRVHIMGDLQLHDGGYASGGFLSDSKVDGTIIAGPQQQWLTRNSEFNEWTGGAWNIMFLGVANSPEENWPQKPYTRIEKTPLVREKPFLIEEGGKIMVVIPALKTNSSGPDWQGDVKEGKKIPVEDFYLVKPGADDAQTINAALQKGKDLLITPGIYQLTESLRITKPGTIIIGLGMPSLEPVNGNMVLEVADVDGITLSGLLIDAGLKHSKTLLQMGDPESDKDHANNPSFLFDLFFRVGGPHEGYATSCITMNSNNVYMDHIWLWRADHGNGAGWETNPCANGIIVNGNDVTAYGLFNEHFQEYQLLWNGENGKVYFYQCEMPYDPPTVESYRHDDKNGYASYKVADHVTNHEAWCVGIYCVFRHAPIVVDAAIETPPALENQIHRKFTFFLGGGFKNSKISSVINGKGPVADETNVKAAMD